MVAVVNETFVEHYFDGGNSLGRRFRQGREELEIVGVVSDWRDQSIRSGPADTVYIHERQGPRSGMTLLVRAGNDPERVVPSLLAMVGSIDRRMPVATVHTLDADVEAGISSERMLGYLSTLFAALTLLLAGIGLYGVLASAVVRRTREIGLRLALGARRDSVVLLLGREGAVLLSVGVAVGGFLAVAGGQALRGVLFGVAATDPLTMAGSIPRARLDRACGYRDSAMARRAHRPDGHAALGVTGMGHCLRLTVIVPAFNEEACLAPTLDSVHAASERLRARSRVDIETIVVDNNSNDGTATVARTRGATVIHEPVQGIGRARNTGARHATGDVLGFRRCRRDRATHVPGRSARRDGRPEMHRRRSGRRLSAAPPSGRALPPRLAVAGQPGGDGAGRGRSSAARAPSNRSAATTKRRGSARTSTSTGACRNWPRRAAARSAWFENRACAPPAGASTTGRCGSFWSGPTPSSSHCSGAGRRSGKAGTRTRYGRRERYFDGRNPLR